MPAEPAWEGLEEEPLYISGPGEGVIFFGVKAWTPERESSHRITCRVCGGEGCVFNADDPDAAIALPFRFDAQRHVIVTYGDDPLNDRAGLCAACMRWKRDDWLAARIASDAASRGAA